MAQKGTGKRTSNFFENPQHANKFQNFEVQQKELVSEQPGNEQKKNLEYGNGLDQGFGPI